MATETEAPERICVGCNLSIALHGVADNESWGCELAKLRAGAAPHLQQGLNLFRQVVSGKNALRQLDVFWCNNGEHDAGCKCFWEQCEAWAKRDAENGLDNCTCEYYWHNPQDHNAGCPAARTVLADEEVK